MILHMEPVLEKHEALFLFHKWCFILHVISPLIFSLCFPISTSNAFLNFQQYYICINSKSELNVLLTNFHMFYSIKMHKNFLVLMAALLLHNKLIVWLV